MSQKAGVEARGEAKLVLKMQANLMVRLNPIIRGWANYHWHCVASRASLYHRRAYTRLEPDEGKVLRGGSASNGALLPDYDAMFKNPKRHLTEVACWGAFEAIFFGGADFRLVSSHGDAGLLSAVVRGGAGSSQRQCGTTPGIAPGEIASDLEDIKNYLQTEKPKVLPKCPIGVAIDYTTSNWDALLRYTEDGELEIDSNGAERSLRPIVTARSLCTSFSSV
jgi:hypothetical protein